MKLHLKRRLLLVYWSVLLVSTLAIGAVAFYLLERENERLHALSEDSARRKGQTISGNLNLNVDKARHSLMEALASFSDSGLEPQLIAWKDSSPYVREVFLYRPERRDLVLPPPRTPQRLAMEQSLRLPAGGWVWGGALAASNGFTISMADANGVRFTQVMPLPQTQASSTTTASFAISNLTATITDGVITLSQGDRVLNQQNIEMMSGTQTDQAPKPEQAWVRIGPADDPHWIGWQRSAPGGAVRGMELSWSGLTPLMRDAFPARLESGEGFILRNPSGQVVIARFASDKLIVGGDSGKPVDDPQARPTIDPLMIMPVGAGMPGWTLAVYFNPAINFSNSFMLVSTFLVALLVISVLGGGTLLLREARREATDAARRTNFVSNVSHELKTPLTTIRMYAELLGEGRVRDPARQHNYLNTIIGESQRLTRLVNNVLDFSRLEQGHKQYHPDNVALGPIVEGVLATQRLRLEETGFVCETDGPLDDDLLVHADRDAIEQVLLNLIDNALKYAAAGRWLGVRISKDSSNACVAVSDHGPGVPLEHRERIFEMFHRVDDSITAKQPGTGLGLSIARRLLRDQGGDLRYEPNEPQGACFVATIPLAPVAAPRAAEPVAT